MALTSAADGANMMADYLRENLMDAMSRVRSGFHPYTNRVHTGSGLFILAVLPRGGHAADHPRYLHCAERALGLAGWAEAHDATLVATDDKDARNSVVDQMLPQADVVITSPYYPLFFTHELFHKADKLKLVLNLSEGSDHIDLHAAAAKDITVVQLAGSSVEAVAEDQIMRCLIILRNFNQGYHQIREGQWDVPAATADAYDLKNKVVGTLGGGKVGRNFIKRLVGWNAKKLLYHDLELKTQMEMLQAAHFVPDLDTFLSECDVVVINVPLTARTRHLMDAYMIQKMKPGAVLINDSHGDIVDRDAVVNAVNEGFLKGFGGDMWDEVPPRVTHPWRHLACHTLTPPMAGLTIDAQESYARATTQVLDRWTAGKALPNEYYVVRDGIPKYTRL